jgi:hypothetical protein
MSFFENAAFLLVLKKVMNCKNKHHGSESGGSEFSLDILIDHVEQHCKGREREKERERAKMLRS